MCIVSQVDMWACGVVLYTMVRACYPFEVTMDDDQGNPQAYHGGVGPGTPEQNKLMMEQLKAAEYDLKEEHASPLLRDLMAHLLCADAAKRFSSLQALKHAWTRGGKEPEEEEQVEAYASQLTKDSVAMPEGDDPETWLTKLGPAAGAAAAAKPDVEFEDEDAF